MLPGPTIIRECPHCGNPGKQDTIISGNTFGAVLWSDGKQVAPMMPRPPSYVFCMKCNEMFWLKDARKIAEIDSSGKDEKYKDTSYLVFPTFLEEIRAIELISDKKFVRTMALYSFNDYYRDRKESEVTPEMQKLHEENLYELEPLFDVTKPEELIAKAEVNRLLGRFDVARLIIESITDPKFEWIRAKFLAEINKENKQVFRLY